MTDIHDVLLRRQREIRIHPGAFDRLVRRRTRRRRAQAATSAAVALAVAAVAAWTVGHAFDRRGSLPATRPITPDNVSGLRVAWKAHVGDAAQVAPIVSSTHVFVLGRTVHAFPRTCQARACSPEWIGGAGSSNNDPSFAAGDRTVFMASEWLWGFPQDCGGSAASCDPTWTSSNTPFEHFSSVAVADGIVFGQAYFGDLYAYPEDCTGSCRPLWHAHTYGNQSAVVVGSGFVFAQNDHALRAFPEACRRDGGLCRPVWSTPIDSLSSQPAYADGRVYAIRGQNEIVAYDAACPRRSGCRPRGTWHVPGVSSFAVSGSQVYVATGDRVTAFPTICPPSLGCHPLWRTGRLGAPPSTPVASGGLVFFTAGPDLYSTPVDCVVPGPACAQPFVTRPSGVTGSLSAPGVAEEGVYVLDDRGTLYALEVPGGSADS